MAYLLLKLEAAAVILIFLVAHPSEIAISAARIAIVAAVLIANIYGAWAFLR